MSKIMPFKGYRPAADKVEKVASPPYDVLNSNEARQMAGSNEYSFLHVVKPEIDLPEDISPYDDAVYKKGKENLKKLINDKVLVQDESPCLYLYEQRMDIAGYEHVQVGVVAGTSILEYRQNIIKKHELTREVKEKDRTKHVKILGVNSGPVFLTYKESDEINEIVSRLTRKNPDNDFKADDGISHRFWVVSDSADIDELKNAFNQIPALYIADGHHRSASGAAAGEAIKAEKENPTDDEQYNYFLSVMFPHSQMYIMDYNRVVMDLNGLTSEEFTRKISDKFEVKDTSSPKPSQTGHFGMFLDGKWKMLVARQGSFDADDPVASLDVAILQNNLLEPVLGIKDPRTDLRIDFVGGIRGTQELEKRVNDGGKVAFAMFPTSIEQLMSVADASKIMPPKSTWFEPKLRSGMVVRPLE